MCGYCTELIAILALQPDHQDSPSDSSPSMGDVYLQEVRDLPEAFRRLGANNTSKPYIALVIMCRAIDMLVREGFHSTTYQEMLRLPQFVSAISVACEECAKAALDDTDSRLNSHEFAWLADRNTYLTPGCFEQHCDLTVQRSCIALLSEYVEWWLAGGSVDRQYFDPARIDMGKESADKLYAIDYDLFDRRFPALWFSLNLVARQSPAESVMWDIAEKCPAGITLFSGLDLWLQRRAVLACYDQQGISYLLESVPKLRSELFQFLAAARAIKSEDKASLIAALEGYESYHSGPTSEWYWAEK
jgi:hypothetical protein